MRILQHVCSVMIALWAIPEARVKTLVSQRTHPSSRPNKLSLHTHIMRKQRLITRQIRPGYMATAAHVCRSISWPGAKLSTIHMTMKTAIPHRFPGRQERTALDLIR